MAKEVRLMVKYGIQARRFVPWLVGLVLGLLIVVPNDGFAQLICEDELLLCQTERDLCLGNLDDQDDDGELDLTDQCPGTRANAQVDAGGCSRAQFCSTITVSDSRGRRNCTRADWQGDASGKFLFRPRDCRVDSGNPKEPFNRADDRCVAR
jgi:hypothetical protein